MSWREAPLRNGLCCKQPFHFSAKESAWEARTAEQQLRPDRY